ncbi:MAG: DUF4143 domain-containing protein [Planctomycetes bacterium]|nr:DUF4143 domain-containing protein [Planctomycetota bacterium]
MTHTTSRRWLPALEASYIVHRLPPLHCNVTKRLVKSPKLHFLDTGLACHLLGIRNEDDFAFHPLRGALFELGRLRDPQGAHPSRAPARPRALPRGCGARSRPRRRARARPDRGRDQVERDTAARRGARPAARRRDSGESEHRLALGHEAGRLRRQRALHGAGDRVRALEPSRRRRVGMNAGESAGQPAVRPRTIACGSATPKARCPPQRRKAGTAGSMQRASVPAVVSGTPAVFGLSGGRARESGAYARGVGLRSRLARAPASS